MHALKDTRINYKQQKEAFVTGHTGQPVKEVIKLVAVIFVCILSFMFVAKDEKSSHFFAAALQSWHFGQNYGFFHFLIEYGLYYVIPLLFSTILSSYLEHMILGFLFSVPILWFCTLFCKKNKNSNDNTKKSFRYTLKGIRDTKDTGMKSYVSTLRGTIMLISCLSILAVDFKIFPRKHAKVETWGISLMDLGVGFFVFSFGVVTIKNIKNKYSSKVSFIKKMKISLKQSYMFFVIGFIRILIIKICDYPEHVSEYGVHWNFFFTLGVLSLSLVFIEFLHQYLKSYIFIIILLSICNELLIRLPHVLAYILNAPRTNLISANREGIFSLIGYLIIYLSGIDTGKYLFYENKSSKKNNSINQYKVILKIFSLFVFYSVISYYFTFYGKHPISRRLTNLPYVYLISACSLGCLVCQMLIEILFFGSSAKYIDIVPLMLHYVNKNGLIIFLIGNLITGLINSSINTLEVGNVAGFLIMIIYGIILCGVAFIIDIKEWKFKF
ncbi:glucosaminyl-phosphotidylinositol O-acyltransferase [Pneumocystis jirovecii RU7]|uniref:GPI-anchored wall transfer protein n=1 Tax=Pneumocystis jirovecii (strain RU7) TaxID=1408657 RepID=A0A0W4ZV81_PNEJ7|nr:glucosaminyl-phosphotidylinositol O-acyltransferase [Pneumocystis jirovecii RU7]KTW32284.1 hypothetical protein T551_00375 [Pneumocystis jirovecii RU7]